jgi:hypothetical protein
MPLSQEERNSLLLIQAMSGDERAVVDTTLSNMILLFESRGFNASDGEELQQLKAALVKYFISSNPRMR